MKTRDTKSEDHNADTGQPALPFSKSRSTRLALFGIAGSLLVVGLVAANTSKQPTTNDQKASNMLSNAPITAPKEEDKADDAHHAESAAKTKTSTSTSSSSSSSSHSTEVEVNGHNIDVPENGQVHRVITENNSHTTVDISSSSDNSSFSTDINVRSFSSED